MSCVCCACSRVCAAVSPGDDDKLKKAKAAVSADVRSRMLHAAVKGLVRAVKAKHPNNAKKIAAAKRRGLSDDERGDVLRLCDVLDKIFVYDPEKRVTAKDVLRHDFFKGAV